MTEPKHLLLAKFSLFSLLCLFLSITGAAASPTLYNVRDYGALGDGKTLDSPAINSAIEAASKAGGGTIFFPAGKYSSGTIRMKSNIHLYLDIGSVLVAAPQYKLEDYYDRAEKVEGKRYQDEGHSFFENSLIWGKNLKNVSISGFGRIDGTSLTKDWKDKNTEIIALANKTIALRECTNVQIHDITIFRGGWFAILLTGCNLVTLDNLTIDTNRDGIDLDCCTNVVVSNCKVNSPQDDAICPKSSYVLGRSVVTENMVITNCQVSAFQVGTLLDGTFKQQPIVYWTSRNGRIKFGTESNGGFRNITVSNCTFRDCKGLAIEAVDGGVLENISVSNLTMYNADSYPIYITLGERLRDPNPGKSTGRDISISNVVAYVGDSLSGIHISGIPNSKLENIRLSNIHILVNGGGKKQQGLIDFPEIEKNYPEINAYSHKKLLPAYGLYARHIKNLELDNVSVDFKREDKRPAMICIDVQGLDISKFRAGVSEGIPVARFEAVTNLHINNSPQLEQGMVAYRDGKWLLTRDGAKYRLFDLEKDKSCEIDIAPKNGSVVKELIGKLKIK